MDRPFVHRIRVENYRCVSRADLHLTPLHALVGPNDSGKSSLLSAIDNGHATAWLSAGEVVAVQSGHIRHGKYPDIHSNVAMMAERIPPMQTAWQSRRSVRLDPDRMRRPSELIEQHKPIWFDDPSGEGLASVYDAILSRDRAAFAAIDARFCELFPTVKALRVENTSSSQKAIAVTLRDGREVSRNEISEGMLYWLAFAVLQHLVPAAIYLIEEPENGLHPARIAEVVRVLREVSQRTQIIMATHSPLVINELKAEEVTVVTRSPTEGTICTPMVNTKNFAERSKTYALGELWLAYADGNFESNLVPNN